MNLHSSLLLFLAAAVAQGRILASPLSLAVSFSSIGSELDHISLGSCSLADATLPLNDTKTKLPVPATHLSLKYVALGRGTQNYSCATSKASTTPEATGAAATLFDASCLASTSLTLLHEFVPVVGHAPLGSLALLATTLGQTTNTTDLIIGEHYFNAAGDPFFDLRLGGSDAWLVAKKNASAVAPKRPAKALANDTSSDVPWLKLGFKSGHSLKEVYRVVTHGGSAPSTCAGQNVTIHVDYAAEYWFYG
ncbi:hypothetical protein NUU61_008541 [Penicillium alfredii]|uniref:Malate dehydrogenase n=1 Tax=Penicillium alfredii TaxID=1506179 RepID=A0A9W9ELE7_9EURO|nr:uncharacterized protein NUU61_008541 [Penicillium alfredii]KAJ5083962.1 hypothetical protein NUU61_008541 [Penicillium alfredii]